MQTVALISLLETSRELFSPVVPFVPGRDKLVSLDFTASNKELNEQILPDTNLFTNYISDQLARSGARYGIGGYAEHRTVYSRSKLFGNKQDGSEEEPRRLHLGTDIWGKPHTPVTAPLDGIVHSFAFNNNFGDYGATIILSHYLSGISFHTLYGHLSLNSIRNRREGERISRGDIFAEFGIPSENGQWPPHLHFQIIAGLQGWKGDYPGVCKYSEKEIWLANCPDPDLILQMNRFIDR